MRPACNLLLPWSNRISGGFVSAGDHGLATHRYGVAASHGIGFSSALDVVNATMKRVRRDLRSEAPGP